MELVDFQNREIGVGVVEVFGDLHGDELFEAREDGWVVAVRL